jgi:hypothetical protein
MPEQKSISVAKVRDMANDMLLGSPREAEEWRQGVADLLERILRETRSYHGYGEFSLDNADSAAHGLRRQYYKSPAEGVSLVRFVYQEDRLEG